ncbi:hypothetical protein CDL15_Pgr001862 [Punica granatum]|uniref:Auxin-responsive protein n=1 Tax=Punica granatum TaxID=22663 RepID=A0A218XBX5_PUNGR|nr:hypothetical protein CDL15_Pgr001862 [Punica granatum]
MSAPGRAGHSPEMVEYSGAMNLDETELTLGLPGGESRGKSGTKRGFPDTIDLSIGAKRRSLTGGGEAAKDPDIAVAERREDEVSGTISSKPPATKTQVVGWPPVRSFRKNVMTKSCKFVKVAVDGAPYLRKVDLEMYSSYQQLLAALEGMFSCFTIRKYLKERKLMDPANGGEYVPTYEDKDGDWMLVGDVPWKMFVESCKRLRLMKGSEAVGLGN